MTPTTRTALPGARWRKSSHSGDEGACVEMAVVVTGDPGSPVTHSRTPVAGSGDSGRTVAVRDSKDPHGPVLFFSSTAWATFTSAPPQRVPAG